MDMIIASVKFDVGVVKKLCQGVFNRKDMPKEWKTSVVVSILMDCGVYRGVKMLELVMNVVERVLENRIIVSVAIDDMQFAFLPGQGTAHALFILRRRQEEYCGREKSCACVLWI